VRRRRSLFACADGLGRDDAPCKLYVITGPEVIKAVTGEDVTMQDLGAQWYTTARAASHISSPRRTRRARTRQTVLSYLPQNNTEDPPQVEPYDPADRWMNA